VIQPEINGDARKSSAVPELFAFIRVHFRPTLSSALPERAIDQAEKPADHCGFRFHWHFLERLSSLISVD
jgi:hypothetical protein